MELYVIRHGQTLINVLGMVNGRNRIGLNRVGKAEAKNASKEVEKLNIDFIFCSPLKRTKQTCKLCNKNNVEVIYDERLLERNSNKVQFNKISKLNLNDWYDRNKAILNKGAEGFQSLYARTVNLLEELKMKYPEKSIMIVTHGDVCKAVYAYCNNITDSKMISEFNQGNCEIKKYTLI